MRFHFGTLHHEIMPSPFPSALGLFWRFLSVSVSPDPAFYSQFLIRLPTAPPSNDPQWPHRRFGVSVRIFCVRTYRYSGDTYFSAIVRIEIVEVD